MAASVGKPGGEVPDPIRTLIVDDEPPARTVLRIRLRDVPDFQVIAECASGEEAVAAVAEHRPDLLFLDIRLPDMDGFGVLERIDPEFPPVVVFVTAYDHFALEAFRVHALDYLLKPIGKARFDEALDACRQRVGEVRRLNRAPGDGSRRSGAVGARLPRHDDQAGNPYLDRMVIRARGSIFCLKMDSVDWVEACGDYLSLHVGEKTWLVRQTMQEMEAGLDPRVFARISRSAIINRSRVENVRPAPRREYLVRLRGGTELKLTVTYREKLATLLPERP
jgi:two-component system, LytTR family, response regulator